MTIDVKYVPSIHQIDVLSDILRINFTKEYVMDVAHCTEREAKRILVWAAKLYNDEEGINNKVIRNLAKGVQSGLL